MKVSYNFQLSYELRQIPVENGDEWLHSLGNQSIDNFVVVVDTLLINFGAVWKNS